jgi:hypothetical protein
VHITAHTQLSGNVRLRWARYAIRGRPRERETHAREPETGSVGSRILTYIASFGIGSRYIDRYIEHAHTSRVSLVTVI